MARIVGSSGCTAELLANLRRVGLCDLATFADIEWLNRAVVADARALEETRLRARISELLGAAVTLEEDVERQAALRRVELAAERDRLPVDLANLEVQPARSPVRAVLKWSRKIALRLRLRALTRHLEREVQRPYRRDLREARRHRASAAKIERNLKHSLDAAAKPLSKAKHYLEDKGKVVYYGADGEERVLAALRALPDEFTVFNDVTFSLPKAHRWRKHNEWVRQAQVDHVVVGNDCIFLLETKNWSERTLKSATFTPQHQVERANHVVYCLGKRWFGNRDLNLCNLVVMTGAGAAGSDRPPKLNGHVWDVPLGPLLHFIQWHRPRGTNSVTSAEACRWIQRFVR
jgi:hypothetical protein